MSQNNYLQSYCHIQNGKIISNGNSIPFEENISFNEFMKSIYVKLEIDYPKFYKMDELCKLAFIAAEMLLKKSTTISGENTAIILSNASSTLETDLKHQESIKDVLNYFPSPSTFVYTLPNITIGEIAIRHKITGENTFFVSEEYDFPFMFHYTTSLLDKGLANWVLTGWVEFNSSNYNCFICLVSKDKLGIAIPYTSETIQTLFK